MVQKLDVFKSQHSEELQELRRQLEEKNQVIATYRKEHGKLEVFFNKVKDAIQPLSPFPKAYEPPVRKKLVDNPCFDVVRISDSHYGMVQPKDEIEGFGEYNPDISHERQIKYINKHLDWINVQRQGYTINECSVIVTGDLISGDIQRLPVTNAFPSPVQVVGAGDILAEQIALLSPHFEKVTVHFITADNHSRLTDKPQSGEEGQNSLNYLVGHIAKLRLSKFDNVEFNIYPFHEKVVSVATRNYLISHGHGLPQYFGVPWYSIERRVGRESTARLQDIMNYRNIEQRAREIGFHKLAFGHFHIFFEHDLYSCCPSVSGTDANDHKFGRHSRPGQTSWLVHPNYGEFNYINFLLDV